MELYLRSPCMPSWRGQGNVTFLIAFDHPVLRRRVIFVDISRKEIRRIRWAILLFFQALGFSR